MLTIIGLLPSSYALNPKATDQLTQLSQHATQAVPLIQRYGDDVKAQALKAATALQQSTPELHKQASQLQVNGGKSDSERATRAQLRGYICDVVSQMKHVGEVKNASPADKKQAGDLLKQMSLPVEYAPLWVRMLSSLCLGIGTMVGYRRVVRTLGERLCKQHMTPGQGASAELIVSVLIGTAGFTGLPVSTTHIVTSGIAGTMVAGGQGVQGDMLFALPLRGWSRYRGRWQCRQDCSTYLKVSAFNGMMHGLLWIRTRKRSPTRSASYCSHSPRRQYLFVTPSQPLRHAAFVTITQRTLQIPSFDAPKPSIL